MCYELLYYFVVFVFNGYNFLFVMVPKRKVPNPRNWKRNIKKNKQFENEFREVRDCCSLRCFDHFKKNIQESLFDLFQRSKNKEVQDTYLTTCLKHKDAVKKTGNQKRTNVWEYYLSYESGVDIRVCCKFFLKLYQLGEKRLRNIRNKNLKGVSLNERRGNHSNHPIKMTEAVVTLIEEHLEKIPSKISHYANTRTTLRYFENSSNLTVMKLYKLFRIYYKKKTNQTLTLAYNTYHRFFRTKTNYAFNHPKVDVCDDCHQWELLLKSTPNHECKAEYKIHKRKVKAFQQIKNGYIEDAKNHDDILTLEFDYAQNLPLPKLNVNKQFYKRLLWFYNFNVHCYNDNSSSFYTFLEGESKKGSNSVISFLNDFISQKMKICPNIRSIILFSDAAGGQNKNLAVCKYLTWLSNKHAVSIDHIFPVRGHSFCQCDRNFGLYGRILKKKTVITHYRSYLKILSECRNPPFFVVKDDSLLQEWSDGLEPLFLQKPSNPNHLFTLQKYVRLKYVNGSIFASKTFDPIYTTFQYWRTRNSRNRQLVLQRSPAPGLTEAKAKDIRSLLPYVTKKNRDWFEDIVGKNDPKKK